tara:strand:+ start:876 stop:1205 length:330 start_codon:yes stop_codon:yes gene_type:complete
MKQHAMKDQMIIHSRCKEWHGDEAMVEGSYKPKGDRDFIITLNHHQALDHTAAIRAAFNEIYDQEGLRYRYEFQSIEIYIEPVEIKDIACMQNLINKHINDSDSLTVSD